MVELQSRVPNDEVFGMQRLAVQPRGGKEEEREKGRTGRTGQKHNYTVYSTEARRGEFSNIHCLPENKLQKYTPSIISIVVSLLCIEVHKSRQIIMLLMKLILSEWLLHDISAPHIEDCEGWWLSSCHSSGRALAAQARCPGFDSRRLPAL